MNNLARERAGEGELLYPPLAHLEVIGEPTLREHRQKRVVVVSVRVNINQKGLTIEEMLRQRKRMVKGVADSLVRDIQFDLKLVGEGMGEGQAPFLGGILTAFEEKEDSWFNVDQNLKEAMSGLLEAKQQAISRIIQDWKLNKHPSTEVCQGNRLIFWHFSFSESSGS
jgi:hypothetical protein